MIDKREEWQQFIDEALPHTFLHTWEWKLSQEVLGNKTFNLGIYNENKLIGVAFVYKIVARRGSFLFCPHGPIIKEEKEKAFAELFIYLKDLAKKEKVDFIRISPIEKRNQEIEDQYKNLGFRGSPIHTHPELSWMLDVSITEEQLLKDMKKRTRYSITKAQKDNVRIVSSTDSGDIEKFYDTYLETASRQIFVPFSKNYIKKEFEIFNRDGKILLFFAKLQEEIIATAMIIYSNGSGFYHHGASTRNHANIPASEYLQWHAILEAKKRGMNYYNFWGIAPEELVNHPWVGITRFKKGFGGFAEEYIHSQDYPITIKYWLNYAVETLRRIKRRY